MRDRLGRSIPDLIAAVLRFAAAATPQERADLAALLPVVLGRRERTRAEHVAAQAERPTGRGFVDAATTRVLTMLRGDLG